MIEGSVLPFAIERVYYLYDVPSDAARGGHAHKEQLECLVALGGSFSVLLDDGSAQKTVVLNKPNQRIAYPYWHVASLDDFSSGAVCLVLSSGRFDEADYIRDYADFLAVEPITSSQIWQVFPVC